MPTWDIDQTSKFVQQLLVWKDAVDAEIAALKSQSSAAQGGAVTDANQLNSRLSALEARPTITQEQLNELDAINTKIAQLQQILGSKT